VTSLVFNIEETDTDLISTSFFDLIEHMSHLRSLSRQDLSILAGLSHDIAFEAIQTLHV